MRQIFAKILIGSLAAVSMSCNTVYWYYEAIPTAPEAEFVEVLRTKFRDEHFPGDHGHRTQESLQTIDARTGQVIRTERPPHVHAFSARSRSKCGFAFEQADDYSALRIRLPGGTVRKVTLESELERGLKQYGAKHVYGVTDGSMHCVFMVGIVGDHGPNIGCAHYLWRLQLETGRWSRLEAAVPGDRIHMNELSALSRDHAVLVHFYEGRIVTHEASFELGEWHGCTDGWFRPDGTGTLIEYEVSSSAGAFQIRRLVDGETSVYASLADRGARGLRVQPLLGGRVHLLSFELRAGQTQAVVLLDEDKTEQLVLEVPPWD